MKNIEFHARTTKIKNLIIPNNNNENYENLWTQFDNYENHDKLRIPYKHFENH